MQNMTLKIDFSKEELEKLEEATGTTIIDDKDLYKISRIIIDDYVSHKLLKQSSKEMTISDYINKYNISSENMATSNRVAFFLSRYKDLLVNKYGEDDTKVYDYLQTRLNKSIIYNLERICSDYFETLEPGDILFVLQGYPYTELLNLVTTD